MTKEQLKKYYEANIKFIEEQMARTDLTDQQKWYHRYTQEGLDDYKKCLEDLNK